MVGCRSIPAMHGGLERAVEELSAELQANGHQVTVHIDRAHRHTESYRGIQIDGVRAVRTKHLHTLTQVASTVSRPRKFQADVVHIHGVGSAVITPALLAQGKPVVLTVQGLDWERDKWSAIARAAFRPAALSALRFPSAVIAVSRTLQEKLRERYDIDAHYIPNGVRPATHVPAGRTLNEFQIEAGQYILFAARLVPEKGLDYLFKAYELLEVPRPKLVVAGSGSSSYADDYEASLRGCAPDGTIFTGFQSGVALAELFSNAACFVLPSVLEGLPLGLLEAMSYGLPVVHSDIPECMEITEGGAGFSFPVGDEKALASALTGLLENPSEAASVGAAGRERVETRYGWSMIAGETMGVYRQVNGSL